MINDTQLKSMYQETSRNSDLIVFKAQQVIDSVNILNFKYNAKIDEKGQYIGTCIPKEIQITLRQENYTFTKGEEIRISHQVTTPVQPSARTLSLGTFYVEEVTQNEKNNTIEILFYDRLMQLKNVEITPAYPITIRGLLNLIKQKTQININENGLVFVDFNIPKEINFGEKTTVMHVLKAIAQVHASFVYIDNANIVHFNRPVESRFALNNQNVYTMDIGDRKQKTFNSIVISRQPQNDDIFYKDDAEIQRNGLSELKISNNPILDLDREYFAQRLLPLIKTADYEQSTITMQSNPLIEVGDLITFVDLKGTTHKMLITEHEMTISQSTLKCEIADKTETNYKRAKSLEKRVIETELYVDKVENRIVSRIEEISSELGSVKGVVQAVTPEAITTTITSIVNEKAESFATIIRSDTAPVDTTKLWFDNVSGQMKKYRENEWVKIIDFGDIYRAIDNEIARLQGTLAKEEQLIALEKQLEEEKEKAKELASYNAAKLNSLEIFKETLIDFQNSTDKLIKAVRINENGIRISQEGNPLELGLDNGELAFYDGGVKVANFTNRQLIITNVRVLNKLQIGQYVIEQLENTPLLAFMYTGGNS